MDNYYVEDGSNNKESFSRFIITLLNPSMKGSMYQNDGFESPIDGFVFKFISDDGITKPMTAKLIDPFMSALISKNKSKKGYHDMKKGLLVIISGPAGSGKGTVNSLLLKDPSFVFSVSATTRAPRPGEENGVNYYYITHEEFESDMLKSYDLMRKAGIEYKDAPLYIPPYEYYNKEISAWAKSMGIQVVNFTPGTGSNADYTTPDMKNYRSSQVIYDNIMAWEKKEGLNGHLILIHFGTHDDRTDKFYKGYMEKMIKTLKRKGYVFTPLREAVGF